MLLGIALMLLGLSSGPMVVDGGATGMTRQQFEQWHLGSLGVPATDKEWQKADKDQDSVVTGAEQKAYEACCQFRPKFTLGELPEEGEDLEGADKDIDDSIWDYESAMADDDDEDDEVHRGGNSTDDSSRGSQPAVNASTSLLPEQTQGRVCKTLDSVDQLVKEFEAKAMTAEAAKEVLRRTLYALGVRRVQSDANPYGTMTTPVKTAILKELVAGTKESLKQKAYEVKAAAKLAALGKAPHPPCADTDDDCAFFAEKGECENTEAWMRKHCPKSCGVCVDETPFVNSSAITHLQGVLGGAVCCTR
jgi:hypothetical protein